MRAPTESWLTDMDGVLVREEHALPGAADFLGRLVQQQRRFLVLTNNSIFTPRDLSARLARFGLDVRARVDCRRDRAGLIGGSSGASGG